MNVPGIIHLNQGTIRRCAGFSMATNHNGMLAGIVAGWLLLLAGVGVGQAAPEPERIFEGRSLTSWLALAEEPNYPVVAFSNAITAMGKSIVPRLIEELDPPPGTNRVYVEGAIAACQVMGTNARPTMPALARQLAQGHSRAASALATMGPEAVPILADTLVTMQPRCGAQYYTAYALASLGMDGRHAITNLALMVNESKINAVRCASMRALGAIAGALAETEPGCDEVRYAKAVLMKGLTAPEVWFLSATLDGVKHFKTGGGDFAPKLQILLLDKQQRENTESIQSKLRKTLDAIDPKGIFRTGTTS